MTGFQGLRNKLNPAKGAAPVVKSFAVGPAPGLVMKLLVKYGLEPVSFKIEAYGLDMLVSNVEDDIEDARIFYEKFATHVNEERRLRSRVRHCIHKTERALETFKEFLNKHNDKQALSILLEDGAKIKKLVVPLQASQSQLARRIDWMRAALADLEKGFDPSKEKGGLA
ncbi:hypothetical protein NCS57_01255900 [Fusarium keratoplasticum]|uniref:Uncharacterized protein n=1 Tax=Fusarium keratoplasticum TaxID=1328300 RepID=A0ACC0QHT7_9HYPO|nr:hypothetical protein NCS57_01255900 [Fusarium keratoplasticum]KAI8655082.1 hypothetical protein NCS57_01255900 [Fusarium keratoplasticum]